MALSRPASPAAWRPGPAAARPQWSREAVGGSPLRTTPDSERPGGAISGNGVLSIGSGTSPDTGCRLEQGRQGEYQAGELAVRHLSVQGTRSARLNNLRSPLASLVGRAEDVARLTEIVPGRKLVTLVGPPGCGKTRLGQEIALGLVDRFRDGAWLVELTSIRDASRIAECLATALGVQDGGAAGPRAGPAAALAADAGERPRGDGPRPASGRRPARPRAGGCLDHRPLAARDRRATG